MNLAFFSTDKERKLVELIEIEAQATCQANEAALFFAFYITIQSTSNELKLDDFFRLQLVLHEAPIHNSTITRNREEVEVLTDVLVPSYLPNWVRVFLRTYI